MSSKLPIVFMFKNQSVQRGSNIDLKMLNYSVRQWIKLYEPGFDGIYICGSYTNKEIDDIVNILTLDYIERKGIKIINVGQFPNGIQTKTQKVNYQAIMAWNHLQKEYILAYNDIFPIKLINNFYLNKEYGIKYKNYENIPENRMYWWLENYIKTLKYLSDLWNIELKTVYEGHTFHTMDKETIELLSNDAWLFMNADRNVIRMQKEIRDGKDIFVPDFIGTTFIKNKWVWDKKKEKYYKGINATLPNHPMTQKLLKKLLKK